MLNEDIIVQRSIMPFRRDFETLRLQDCKTPREMINKLVPFNFVDCKLIVTVDNEILPPDSWDSYELKKGQLVGLNYIPTGGGGGKNTLMLVGVIAAAIAVPALAGMAATAVGNAAVGAGIGAFGAGIGGFTGLAAGAYALTYGAVMIGGSMLLSMASSSLMSVPKQNAGSGQRESTSQYVEGAQNSINKYGIVPIVLGTNRMFPPQAALPFTESSDNNQYCRQLFTYGYGKVQLSDRRLGETSIDDFDEVEMDDRLDADLNQGTKLYTNDVYQENLSLKITKEDSPFVRTTQQNCNEAEIDITFQGLCYINDSGGRDNRTVEFEIQYALSGTEDWTVGVEGLNVTESQTLTVDLSNTYEAPKHKVMGVGVGARRKHVSTPGYQINTFIVLNVEDGTVSTVTTRSDADSVVYPSLTSNMVILGYIDGHSLAYVDRRSYLTDSYISSADDFPVTISGSGASTQVTVGAGTIVGGVSTLTVTDATQQSLRKVKRIVFPSRGQYDIKITRLTDDSEDTRLVNDSYWTALRSITYQDPVKFADISGTAIRIKATDQLNGNISSYNAIVSALIKSYNRETDTWEDDKPSSNPADIFRYVLQSPAFAKHDEITDDRIDLAKLKEWWIYCDEIGLTFDRIIDYDTSIDDVLNDVCAAGVATLSKVNNIYSVIIDNERPYIKGLVTPRNSWDYKGSINYPDLPHALRVEFRNPDVGYETDERIVYMDGYDESNATLYERLQFESCTDENLAYWYGRRYFATALLQPETHSFKMDFEHLTFQRGDRIKFINDVILVGVGQGRIKNLIVDNTENPTVVNGFIIDDEITTPDGINLGVRIRDNAGKGFEYYAIQPVEGVENEFTFLTPITYENAPAIGSLCAFVEDGKELDLIITEIKTSTDQTATITAVDYAPARFDPLEEFPEWESNITLPADYYKPLPPLLAGNIQSDESVMIKNSDGSLTSIMIIPLTNRNEVNVMPVIRCRIRGGTEWFTPGSLLRDANQVILTGLQDGSSYDIEIRYQRQTGLQLLSDPLLLKNVKFVGGSTPPADVKNFKITTTNGLSLFEWTPNEEKDISHYVIKYSADVEDVQWQSAQVLVARVTSNTVTTVIHNGIYLIKAVDLLGNESVNATTILSIDNGARNNVVEELQQHPNWLGIKENCYKSEGHLTLNGDAKDGYYYFAIENQPVLTYIPQDIKLELSNGTITLKAGSKVYVPNGFETNGVTKKFDTIVLTNDINGGTDVSLLYCYHPTNGLGASALSACYSGNTAPVNPINNAYWYDTENNKLKRYSTTTSSWREGYSLPICLASSSSIDQIFNGVGFIGCTTFILPGTKGLVPNGRNADGSPNNVEFTMDSIYTHDDSDTNRNKILLCNANGSFKSCNVWYNQTTRPAFQENSDQYWYNPDDNRVFYYRSQTNNGYQQCIKIADYVIGNRKITSFNLNPEKLQSDTLDLGAIYECYLTGNVKATVVARNRVRDIAPYFREVQSVRNFNAFAYIRSIDYVRNIEKFRTFSTAKWEVKLEMNLSRDGVEWTGWTDFTAAQQTYRYWRFRLHLTIDSTYFVPEVLKASVTVDMPDRYESGEDVLITDASKGATVNYVYQFWNDPSVNVTVQDGAVDDRVEFVSKNNKSFTIKVFNATLNTYVVRSFDYISAGYGRVV